MEVHERLIAVERLRTRVQPELRSTERRSTIGRIGHVDLHAADLAHGLLVPFGAYRKVIRYVEVRHNGRRLRNEIGSTQRKGVSDDSCTVTGYLEQAVSRDHRHSLAVMPDLDGHNAALANTWSDPM